ncbi:L-cystine ABC transporter ATP-binding protein YecC [Zafaria cholistanensis]|uniref:ABC-type polar-amino-acid transporter n=1 Tax=Zafaria cholistanensis TaxID=1682741 RepID=A0A5A7NL65_9MICC|nr:amino acid ABC transporter ATP-binding protein [Zafaria cholistanensis]GER21520.1 L-cystine ABC transporter ATP-binding protein YecC [Zafaria cholistanensis]
MFHSTQGVQGPDPVAFPSGEADATAGGTPILELRDIRIEYKGHEVVHGVSLAVQRGEVIALIGPSGAGKSSLLRSINFLEQPSAGQILVNGQLVQGQSGSRGAIARNKSLAAHRRDVGMVFQQFNLFPHLTALENVVLAQVHSLNRSKEEAVARARQELAHVGLTGHEDKYPAKCSGGQQQRIAIARALAMDPQLMLFDEPTSSLDPELGVEVLNTMKRLASEGMTMLVVTHEMHFAEDVADRVVFMADGAIVEEGPAEQVMLRPSSERAKTFLSAVRGR